MKISDNLPVSLQIAAGATELDNIKIIPVDKNPGIRHTISTFKIGKWEKRLISKSVNFINDDIKKSLKSNEKFYVYCLGNIRKNMFFVNLDLLYDIK
jgi:hypothetical protein